MASSRVVNLVLLAALLLAMPLGAADPQWFRVNSANFVLFTDTSEAKGRRLITDLEARLAELADVIDGIPARQFPIEVFLFKESVDFQQAAPRDPEYPEFTRSAYLLRGADRVFVVARDKSPEDIARDVGHALGHVLFERTSWWRPFWLAEGAAEYFRRVGQNPDNKKINEKEVYSADDLLTIVPSASYDDAAESSASFRTQSYRLFRTVLKDHRGELREYLKVLETPAGNQAKPEFPIDALEAKLTAYVDTRIAPATAPAVEAREAAPEDVALHRGDLLAAADRTSDAGEWYRGDSADARAARAILARFSRGGGEPIRVLDRAAREFQTNGLVQLHFGSIETSNTADIALQATALEKALTLLPRSGRAHAQLARVYTLQGRASDALEHIERALEKEPEFADEYLLLRAEAYMALSQFDDAIRAAELAAASPHLVRDKRYDDKVTEMTNRIREIRRLADAKRLDQIRTDVAAVVAEREPPPPPPTPPPPQKFGDIQYDVQSRTPTEIVNAPLPRYPNALIQKGLGGAITLQVRVGTDGRVTEATIANSQFADLNAATLDAVRRWVFKPATGGGKPVPFDVRVTVRFRVE